MDVGLGSGGQPPMAGELAVIFNRDRSFAGIGLFDPHSPIRIRVLHHGRRPLTIDRAFWSQRLRTALEHRSSLLASGEHTGFRWVNGENDGLGGLVVDCYDTVTVVKVYSAAWFPHLRTIVDELNTLRPSTGVVIRLARNVATGECFGLRDGDVLEGHVPAELEFRENERRFGVDVRQGQKTGTFLDQRANRRRAGLLAVDTSVLDLFCCTGGFTVAALANGATSVHAVDQSPQAIDAVHANVERNGFDRDGVTSTVGDAFVEMERLGQVGQRFGVVVVDPPSFAPRQSDVGAARRAYQRLTALAVPLVAPGGTLVQASCTARISSEDFFELVEDGLDRSGRTVGAIETTGHDVDHPITFAQGAYLKAVFAQLD